MVAMATQFGSVIRPRAVSQFLSNFLLATNFQPTHAHCFEHQITESGQFKGNGQKAQTQMTDRFAGASISQCVCNMHAEVRDG